MSNTRKFAVAFAAAATLAAPAASFSAEQFINVLTGGTSGVYYPLGVALTQVYGKAIPEAKSSVQATKASVENLNMLEAGKGEVAFTQGDSLSSAWKGVEDAGFKQPLKKLRGVAGLYTNYMHVIATADSGIKTLADLKGKRVSVGAPKSGIMINAQELIKAAGMSFQDFARVEYLPYGESVELMKSRQLDATLQTGGLGMASIRDLANSVKIVFIPVPAAVVTKIGDPAYQPGFLPAGTYDGQTTQVPTATIRNFLVTHDGVSADTVYRMTKSMFDNLGQLSAAQAAAKGIKKEEAAAHMPVPLHPGAEKYYREAGLIK